MDLDEDEPPLLVSNGQQDDPSNVSSDMEAMQVSKVPITIVTGRTTLV